MSGAAHPNFRPWLAAGTLFALGGCTSIDADLKSAEAGCVPASVITPYITCLNNADEQVWQKDSPADEAAYRDFATARLGLAQNLDSGKITPAEFSQAASEARTKFVGLVTQNIRARQEAAARRAQNEMDEFQRNMPMQPPATGTGMGMDGIGGMGGGGM